MSVTCFGDHLLHVKGVLGQIALRQALLQAVRLVGVGMGHRYRWSRF